MKRVRSRKALLSHTSPKTSCRSMRYHVNSTPWVAVSNTSPPIGGLSSPTIPIFVPNSQEPTCYQPAWSQSLTDTGLPGPLDVCFKASAQSALRPSHLKFQLIHLTSLAANHDPITQRSRKVMAPFRVSVIPRNGLQPTFWITLPFAGAFQRKTLGLEWLQALGAEAAGLCRG